MCNPLTIFYGKVNTFFSHYEIFALKSAFVGSFFIAERERNPLCFVRIIFLDKDDDCVI